MKTFTTLLTATALFAATGALARETRTHAQTRDLREAKDRVAARASGEKGYPKARLEMERVRLQSLIDDLETGKHVSSSEIDSAIERANQPSL